MNIKITDEGKRIEASSNLQGRVVAKEGIIAPDTLQHKLFYFQYRIDGLVKGNRNPKICIGVCREDFLVNQDLSRQTNVWCINCATGDKFTNKKWKEYYDLQDAEHGLFEVGSLVGVLVNLERGSINFFKDGKDLGEAFVNREIRRG